MAMPQDGATGHLVEFRNAISRSTVQSYTLNCWTANTYDYTTMM